VWSGNDRIVPRALPEMLGDPDPEKSKRVMEAVLKVKKIDIQVPQEAYGMPQTLPRHTRVLEGMW
jgi:hypothetical protein